MPSSSDGEAEHGPDPIADHAGGGDLVARDSDSDATMILPGRGDQDEGEAEAAEEEGEAEEEEGNNGEENEESSHEEGDGGDDEEDKGEVSDEAMDSEESEMEGNSSDADEPEEPSGSNGVRDVGPVCERFGPGKMCDGRGCHPCMDALLNPSRQIYKTPDSKRRPIEKDMSEEKMPMSTNPKAADVTLRLFRVGFGFLALYKGVCLCVCVSVCFD